MVPQPGAGYLTSIVAMPSNFFLMVSASSLVAFSLIALGAPSTRSFASFKPSEVTSRTALMVEILFAPASFEDDLELGLLDHFRCCCRSAAASRCDRSRCCCGNAETGFQCLNQSCRFQQAQAYDLLF